MLNGHEQSGKEVVSNENLFGVSENVYEILTQKSITQPKLNSARKFKLNRSHEDPGLTLADSAKTKQRGRESKESSLIPRHS